MSDRCDGIDELAVTVSDLLADFRQATGRDNTATMQEVAVWNMARPRVLRGKCLHDLHNPQQITAIRSRECSRVADESQAFHENAGSFELWRESGDDLTLVCRALKSEVLSVRTPLGWIAGPDVGRLVRPALFGLQATGDSVNGWPFRMVSARLFPSRSEAVANIPKFVNRCCDTSHAERAKRDTLRVSVVDHWLVCDESRDSETIESRPLAECSLRDVLDFAVLYKFSAEFSRSVDGD